MIYEFEDVATGQTVEVEMDYRKAPAVGKVIRRKGRELRRLVSSGVNRGAVRVAPPWIVTHQFPRNHPAGQHHTKEGWCAFESEAAIQNAVARANGERTDKHEQMEAIWDR